MPKIQKKKFIFDLKPRLEMLFSLSLSPVGRLIAFNNRRFVKGVVRTFLELVENCNQENCQGFSVSLHVFPVSAWVLFMQSGFLTQSKNGRK